MGMKKWIVVLTAVLVFFGGIAAFLVYDGVIWFVNPENKGYTVKGIDVARYQGAIDWATIAAQGIRFSFAKATEGSSYADPTFEANITTPREHGVAVGAYHFFSSESAGETQAANFIETISPYAMDLPPVLDFEIPKTTENKDEVIAEAHVFLQAVEAHFGRLPIIYTTYESYEAFLTDGFEAYPLWFRDLLKEPQVDGREWVFWQYCNRGRLDGIDEAQRYVDLNVFCGSAEEFEQYVVQ